MRLRTGRKHKLHSVGSCSDRQTHEYVSQFGAIASSSVGTVQTLNRWTYDDAARRTSVQRRADDGSNSYEYFTYDDLGQITQIRQPARPSDGISGKTVDYTYDFAGRMLSVTRSGDGAPVWTGYA